MLEFLKNFKNLINIFRTKHFIDKCSMSRHNIYMFDTLFKKSIQQLKKKNVFADPNIVIFTSVTNTTII